MLPTRSRTTKPVCASAPVVGGGKGGPAIPARRGHTSHMRILQSALVLSSALSLSFALTPRPLPGQAETLSDHDLARGRIHYVASCARCHGMRGTGGEGPSLARPRLPRAPDDESLIRIIQTGIPGTGMSETWWLSEPELIQLAGYVRSLAPHNSAAPDALPGDPDRGRELFRRGQCDGCHTVGGFGTSRGSDLTTVGLRRGAVYLRESLVDPAAALPRGQTQVPDGFVDYLVVRVVDDGGTETLGIRMNEDSYTIQLEDASGNLHSFYKPALRELDKQFDRSLMPSYRDAFTDEEIDDLVAYLSTLRGPRGIS